jgi:quinol monooxygenase YgiN
LNQSQEHLATDGSLASGYLPCRLRVVHWFSGSASREELLTYCEAVRGVAGGAEAGCFQNIEEESSLLVIELWRSTDDFADYWRSAAMGEVNDTLLQFASENVPGWRRTELYMEQRFVHGHADVDGDFRPESSSDRKPIVSWPSRGSVRLVISVTLKNLDDAIAGFVHNARDTRREPGCLEYHWWRNLELPDQVLLLELWQSQSVYDHHWQLRHKTGHVARRGSASERPKSNALELYRCEAFRFLYDRWLPVDQAEWSATIAWPQ